MKLLEPISGHMTLRRAAKEAGVTPGAITLDTVRRVRDLLLQTGAMINRNIVKSVATPPDEIPGFADTPAN